MLSGGVCLLIENYSNSCPVWSSRSFLQFVWERRPNQADHQQVLFLGGEVPPMICVQEEFCYVTNIDPTVWTCCLYLLLFLGGHHDSLVIGIVICYTKSFHLVNLWFLLVALSHSGHQDSLVGGIVIRYTNSVGIPCGSRG